MTCILQGGTAGGGQTARLRIGGSVLVIPLFRIVSQFTFLHELSRERLSSFVFVHIPVLFRPHGLPRHVPLWDGCAVNAADDHLFKWIPLRVRIYDAVGVCLRRGCFDVRVHVSGVDGANRRLSTTNVPLKSRRVDSSCGFLPHPPGLDEGTSRE